MTLPLFLMFLGVSLAVDQPAAAPQWKYTRVADELHGKAIDRLELEGVYLTQPSLSSGTPRLVIDCERGRVRGNFFDVGVVVESHPTNLFPGVSLEAKLADKKPRAILVDGLSTNHQGLFFTRGDLTDIVREKKLIIGVHEAFGPEVQIRFDLPSPETLMQWCGSDTVLRSLRKAK
jgi:hypothetical protein